MVVAKIKWYKNWNTKPMPNSELAANDERLSNLGKEN